MVDLRGDERVWLFVMDYPSATRLKLFGHARVVAPGDTARLARLELPDDTARVERGIVVTVVGFEWNCEQHIIERYTLSEVRTATAPLLGRITELEAALEGRSEQCSTASRRRAPPLTAARSRVVRH